MGWASRRGYDVGVFNYGTVQNNGDGDISIGVCGETLAVVGRW